MSVETNVYNPERPFSKENVMANKNTIVSLYHLLYVGAGEVCISFTHSKFSPRSIYIRTPTFTNDDPSGSKKSQTRREARKEAL